MCGYKYLNIHMKMIHIHARAIIQPATYGNSLDVLDIMLWNWWCAYNVQILHVCIYIYNPQINQVHTHYIFYRLHICSHIDILRFQQPTRKYGHAIMSSVAQNHLHSQDENVFKNLSKLGIETCILPFRGVLGYTSWSWHSSCKKKICPEGKGSSSNQHVSFKF